MRRNVTLIILPAALAILLLAGAVQADPLAQRSRIELQGGLWMLDNGTSTVIGPGGVETNLDLTGSIVRVTFAHWAREHLAFTSSLSILNTEMRVRTGAFGVRSSTSSVYSVVFGARYYLPKSTYGKAMRPYLAAAVGPYVGAETKSEVGTTVITESHTEAAIGGYLGGGLDIELSRYLMIGISGGFNLITDFTEAVGSRKNYSSPEFAIGISYLFGGRLFQ